MRQAGEVGPCSAWPSRSAATISASAVSSAMTATSEGPASTSMPDPAEQLALRLGDVGVAGADDHVRRLVVEQAEGHGGERLDAAEGEDPLGSGHVGGVEDRRVRPAVEADGGVQLTTLGTPATPATPTVMKALASRGNRPAGR